MINPMTIYINKLADTARAMCNIDNVISENYILSLNDLGRIIKCFNGELKQFSTEKMNQECGTTTKANSFLKKTAKVAFVIGYCNFVPFDILHELGHAVLELDKMEIGEIRFQDAKMNGGINELNASKFARAFLMPFDLFQAAVITNSKDGFCDIEAVAESFGVNYSQVVSRGREINLWE